MTVLPDLSRRERQILAIGCAHGRTSAAEVRAALSDPPGDSTVRTLLRLLEDKGHLTHVKEGRRFVHAPVVSPSRARRSALRCVVTTLFERSVERAVASLLEDDAGPAQLPALVELAANPLVGGAERERLQALIARLER